MLLDVADTQALHVDRALQALGQRLHQYRLEHGWTLDDLSKRTGISKPHLSRLESGERQPSIAALLALARAFDVPLASLFEDQADEDGDVLVRVAEVPLQEGNGLYYAPLRRSRAATMQPLRVIVPAQREGEDHYSHEGEEWLYVLSGRLRLTLGESEYLLEPGDAAQFDARIPHRLTALGDHNVELLRVACAAPRPLLNSYR
jgi:transcriptional regulator with XRE-family HTH domain